MIPLPIESLPIYLQTRGVLDIDPDRIAHWLSRAILHFEHSGLLPCPICGHTNDGNHIAVDQYAVPICTECWQMNRHVDPALWHCAECGEFLPTSARFVMQRHNDLPLFLCKIHATKVLEVRAS